MEYETANLANALSFDKLRSKSIHTCKPESSNPKITQYIKRWYWFQIRKVCLQSYYYNSCWISKKYENVATQSSCYRFCKNFWIHETCFQAPFVEPNHAIGYLVGIIQLPNFSYGVKDGVVSS